MSRSPRDPNSRLLELIKKTKHVDKDNIQTALKLINESNANDIGYIDNEGKTPLIWACFNSLESVALELIKTDKSNPGHADNDERTALIWACIRQLEKVVPALIETGKSRPGHIDKDKRTALILACIGIFTSEKVVMALIKSNKSNPEQVDIYGDTALKIAKEKGLVNVVKELHKKLTYKSREPLISLAEGTEYKHRVLGNEDLLRGISVYIGPKSHTKSRTKSAKGGKRKTKRNQSMKNKR